MTIEYTYNRGEWIETNELPEWQDGTDFNDLLTLAGFERYREVVIGGRDELDPQIAIYRSVKGGRALATVCLDGDTLDLILLPDLPSKLMFMKEFAALAQHNVVHEAIEEVVGMAKKLFRAYHGHYHDEHCRHCDPVEFDEAQERRREWERKVAERQRSQESAS